MPDINLLPRRKATDWLHAMWLMLIALIGASLVFGQIGLTIYFKGHERQLDSEMAGMQARIDSASQNMRPDERTALVGQLLQELERRQAVRQPWIDGLAALYRYVTSDMKVIHLSIDASDVLRSEMHFATMDSYFMFMNRMNQDARFGLVTANEVILVTGPSSGDAPDGPIGQPVHPPPSGPPEVRSDAELLDQYLPDGSNYQDIGDDLLDLLGVTEGKNANSGEGAASDEYSSLLSDGTPFSLEELRRLDQMQGNVQTGGVQDSVPSDMPARKDAGDYYRVLIEVHPASAEGGE